MKQIIVNVNGLSVEEKQRVNEALEKIIDAKKAPERSATIWGTVGSMYAPTSLGHRVGLDFYSSESQTHTPQQVLEMAGMVTNHIVRKDFDPTKEYSVDVSKCTEEEKKQVQRAFFDVGIHWEHHSEEEYQYLDALQYTNTNFLGETFQVLLWENSTEGCNLPPEEFLSMVYEPEQRGHVHAHLMALYSEDAKTTDKPWELWQIKDRSGIWWECIDNPVWGRDTEYRRKPKTKLIHGVEVPDISFTPKDGEEFVYPSIYDENYATVGRFYSGYELSEMALKAGCCYPYTEEGTQAAIMHAKAMLGVQS